MAQQSETLKEAATQAMVRSPRKRIFSNPVYRDKKLLRIFSTGKYHFLLTKNRVYRTSEDEKAEDYAGRKAWNKWKPRSYDQ